ncbi:MAG: HAMP domain-containing protein [Deltaproteobacteria bacterium]|nr:HAMP domain-containing protein [Deltaproteobacteria bacterium]
MRLWVQLAGAIALVAISLVALTGTAAMRVSTQKASESAARLLERDAAGLAGAIEAWVQTQVSAVEGWNRPFVAGTPELQARLQEAVLLAVPGTVAAAVVDPYDGSALLPPLVLGDTAPGRATAMILRLPISSVPGGGVAFGAPYLPPGDAVPSIPVVAWRVDQPYALGAELSLAQIGALLRRQQGEDRGALLLDEAGASIFAGDGIHTESLLPLLGLAVPSFTLDLDGGEVNGALAPVVGTPWTAVVYEPVAVTARAASAIRLWTLELLGLSVVLALAVGGVLARSLAVPVTRLRESALEVAEGTYSRRVVPTGATEVQDLGRAFNHMAARLDQNAALLLAQREEIQSFNAELQDRVEERTRELEVAQEALVRSGQLAAVGHLGAGLAHELNNPLTAILGLTQVLRVRAGDDPLLAQLEGQALRCREVVEALVRFTREEVDPGEAPVVDIGPVVREVVELVRGPYRQRGLQIRLEEDEGPHLARIDHVTVRHLLVQLLGALEAGLSSGAVVVGLTRRDGLVVIAVDAGMPLERLRGSDEWMTAGRILWVARQMMERVGGVWRDGERQWELCFPDGSAHVD